MNVVWKYLSVLEGWLQNKLAFAMTLPSVGTTTDTQPAGDHM